jgi:hypothetical protein
MSTPITFVKFASFVRSGLARVELATTAAPSAAPRVLAAAAYQVASQLETIAGDNGFAFSVSASKARLGIIEIAYAIAGGSGDGMDDSTAEEILIDACGSLELYPADMLVESGILPV